MSLFNTTPFNTTPFNEPSGPEGPTVQVQGLDQVWEIESGEVHGLDQVWSNPGVQYQHFDQVWALDVPSNVTNNGPDFQQVWELEDTTGSGTSELDQVWALDGASNVEPGDLDQIWDNFGTVSSPLEIPYDMRVESLLEMSLRLNIDVELEVLTTFLVESALVVTSALLARIDPGSELDIRYGDKVRVSSPLSVAYNIIFGRVSSPLEVQYDIVDFNRVSSPLEVIYTLQDETAINITEGIQVTLVKIGEKIEVTQGTVGIEEGSFSWSGQISLANPEDFGKFDFDDEVTLVIPDFANPGNTDTYNMVVDSKNLSRPGPAQFTASIRLVSKSARLDTPRAEPFSGNFESAILASDAIAQILGIDVGELGFDVDDWEIPANRLGGEAASPAELASQIAQATGGLLETNPDGSVYVRYLYPVPVADYDSATPDFTYSETDTILAKSEGYAASAIVNRIRIRDAADSTFGDRIEFEADTEDSRRGTLKVWPSPFREINVEATTSTPPITITRIGELTEELEDVIEIREAVGRISKPITGAPLEVEFLTLNLGGVVIDEGSTTVNVTSPGEDGYTLVRIKYNTRYIAFSVVSDDDRQVQFLVRDSS